MVDAQSFGGALVEGDLKKNENKKLSYLRSRQAEKES